MGGCPELVNSVAPQVRMDQVLPAWPSPVLALSPGWWGQSWYERKLSRKPEKRFRQISGSAA